jgi:bacillithiol system protein YtxJ
MFSGDIKSLDDLNNILNRSEHSPAAIFKHSTRCPISSMALNRLQNGWKIPADKCAIYYLDLIAHRDVSNAVSEILSVKHESPQIQNKKCVYHASHNSIRPEEIEKTLSELE